MEETVSSYTYIIVISVVVILSFIYNAISERTNIPAVLLLILTGIGIQQGMLYFDLPQGDLFPVLQVVGIVGLIMIVLEAALDLELDKENLPIIWKSLLVSLVGLLASTAACAAIIYYTVDGMDTMKALLYATPLSILSSAIIIPSVGNLVKHKKEFHIYESTFSDILGIMLFYFIEGMMENASGGGAALAQFGISLVGTIVISLIASYLLIYMFQNIGSHVKLFFLIAILLLLYALGKNLHLSSLIIILIFGLVMSNHHIFFRGKLKTWLKEEAVKQIEENFHVVTVETAFLVRTFFFVIFGITISLASLWSLKVLQISMMILVSIYLVRYIIFRLLTKESILPQLFIAPRGLITVLLFFSIPKSLAVPDFDQGILLFVIIATSIIMAITLIREKNRQAKRDANSKDDPMVIPPDQIYTGFQSKVLEQYKENDQG